MTTTARKTLTAQYIVDLALKYRDDPTNDYPGMPLSTLPLIARDLLHDAIDKGRVEIVDRERHGRTYRYIAPTGA